MTFLLSYGAYFLVPIHVLVCLILIAVVLLQTGKGTDWASALGGSGTQTTFGPRGVENTLSKLTKFAAALFMVTSLSISLLQTKQRQAGFGALDLPSKADVKKAKPGAEASPGPGAASSPAASTEAGSAPVPAAPETAPPAAPSPLP